jgi:MFS family permease
VSFFVSALILLSLKHIDEIKSAGESAAHMGRELKEAWNLIKDTPTLRLMTLMTLWAFIFLMMGFSQMVLLLQELFPHNTGLLGFLIGLSGIGSIVSGGWLSQKKSLPHYALYMSVGFMLLALNYIILGIYQAHWGLSWLYVLSFADGLGFGVIAVISSYVVKKETPHTHMGRVSRLTAMLQGTVLALGSLLGGLFADWLGLHIMFILGGIGYLFLVGFIAWKRKTLIDSPEKTPLFCAYTADG